MHKNAVFAGENTPIVTITPDAIILDASWAAWPRLIPSDSAGFPVRRRRRRWLPLEVLLHDNVCPSKNKTIHYVIKRSNCCFNMSFTEDLPEEWEPEQLQKKNRNYSA
jgi:hypothetical protein